MESLKEQLLHEALIVKNKQDIFPLSSTSHKDQARPADAGASPDLRGMRSDPIDNLLEKLRSKEG